jgi:sec-independent protein translocase protein TatA
VAPGFLSPWHIAIFLIVVLLLFGPKRLPEAGRALGKGMREFKNSITGQEERDEGAEEVRALPELSGREHDPAG